MKVDRKHVCKFHMNTSDVKTINIEIERKFKILPETIPLEIMHTYGSLPFISINFELL
jgi:hypothetical protein